MNAREAGPGLSRVLLALFLGGLAFRAQVLMLGPLLPEIRDDLGISNGVAGLLGSIPVFCMGALAPFGPVVGRWLGTRVSVALCIAAVIGFGILRAVVPGGMSAMAFTFGIGIGMGLVGPVFTMVVRGHAHGHPTAGTGAYVVGMIVGGSLAAATVVPLAAALGGWRGAALAVSALGILSLAGWWWLAPHDHADLAARPTLPRLPWRRSTGWKLGIMFGLQSVVFYGLVAWLVTVYRERGVALDAATGVLALFTSVGLVATIAVPLFADRLGTRRQQLVGAAALAILGMAGIAFGPAGGLGEPLVLASVLALSMGLGTYFPLVLTLPIDVADSPAEAGALAALMLLVGYAIAAAAPAALGAVRDATGSFEAVVLVLFGSAVLMLPASFLLDPRHHPRARSR